MKICTQCKNTVPMQVLKSGICRNCIAINDRDLPGIYFLESECGKYWKVGKTESICRRNKENYYKYKSLNLREIENKFIFNCCPESRTLIEKQEHSKLTRVSLLEYPDATEIFYNPTLVKSEIFRLVTFKKYRDGYLYFDDEKVLISESDALKRIRSLQIGSGYKDFESITPVNCVKFYIKGVELKEVMILISYKNDILSTTLGSWYLNPVHYKAFVDEIHKYYYNCKPSYYDNYLINKISELAIPEYIANDFLVRK